MAHDIYCLQWTVWWYSRIKQMQFGWKLSCCSTISLPPPPTPWERGNPWVMVVRRRHIGYYEGCHIGCYEGVILVVMNEACLLLWRACWLLWRGHIGGTYWLLLWRAYWLLWRGHICYYEGGVLVAMKGASWWDILWRVAMKGWYCYYEGGTVCWLLWRGHIDWLLWRGLLVAMEGIYWPRFWEDWPHCRRTSLQNEFLVFVIGRKILCTRLKKSAALTVSYAH